MYDRQTVPTSHGRIFVQRAGVRGRPLVMIHGNSSSSEVFARQLRGPLAQACALVTLDLPGHGRSDDASDPARSYSLPGLADCVLELIDMLGLDRPIVLGWSLGGHVAIEMLARSDGIAALVLVGAPPVRRGAIEEGFVASPAASVAGRRTLAKADVEAFARKMFGDPPEAFVRAAIRRSDGRCREGIFAAARAGAGVDQRAVVEGSGVPIAVINGSDDPLIRLDYFEHMAFHRLWGGTCHQLAGAGHAPFWHAAASFDDLVARFVADVDAGRADRGNAARAGFGSG